MNEKCREIYDILKPRKDKYLDMNKFNEYKLINDAMNMINCVSDFLETYDNIRDYYEKAFTDKNITCVIYSIKVMKGETKEEVIYIRNKIREILNDILRDIEFKVRFME